MRIGLILDFFPKRFEAHLMASIMKTVKDIFMFCVLHCTNSNFAVATIIESALEVWHLILHESQRTGQASQSLAHNS
jgi:hypothetical protein